MILMIEELKPCQFCGGKAFLIRVRGSYTIEPVTIRDQWRVSCEHGCCDTGLFHDAIFRDDNGELVIAKNGAYDAVKHWNKRG